MSDQIIRIALDLETMSLEDNAAIVQIGAYVFDGPDQGGGFNSYVNPESSEKAGLHVDVGTMAWWGTQDKAVRDKVFGGVDSIAASLEMFEDWCKEKSKGNLSNIRFYCRGPEFDWVILRNAYYKVLGRFPFHYRSPNSFRTIDDMIDVLKGTWEFDSPVDNSKHDALADAIWDGQRAAYLFNHLRLLAT